MRPIKFDPDLEMIYSELFEPMTVTRPQFKKLIGGTGLTSTSSGSGSEETPTNNSALAQITTLHTGIERIANKIPINSRTLE